MRWCVLSWVGVICLGFCCCWCCGKGLDGKLVGLNASNLCGVGVSQVRRLFVGSSVTLVLETTCSTGTFVYCTGHQCTFGVLSVPIHNMLMGSARSTGTVLCRMCESLFN